MGPVIDMNQRGAVLLYVLVTGVIVSVITAGVLQMTLMNYTATARVEAGTRNRREADGILNRAITQWNITGGCSDIPGGFNCIGTPPPSCNCFCPGPVAIPRITAAMVGGVCTVAITSSVDPP